MRSFVWFLSALFPLCLHAQRYQSDVPSGLSIAATGSITFGTTVPNSVFRAITVPAGGCADLEVFGRDCCIRDDVVLVKVGACTVGSIDSRGGDYGTHPGQTLTLTLGPGTHTVEYRLLSDNEGPSGWTVSETVKPCTGKFLCGGVAPTVEPLPAIPGCGAVSSDQLLHVIEDDAGNRLELKCVNMDPHVDEYRLQVPRRNGAPQAPVPYIGRCPYEGGENTFSLLHTGDYAPKNGKPDCFLTSQWISEDRGSKDDDGDGKLDSMVYDYSFLTNVRNATNRETNSPSVPVASTQGPPSNSPTSVEPQPGSIPAGSMMQMSTFARCDLNKDGVCSPADKTLFEAVLGKQRSEVGYDPFADIDSDGVITDKDRDLLGFGAPIQINALVRVTYSGVLHDVRRRLSTVQTRVQNISGSDTISLPVYLVIVSIDDPFVTLANSDGTTADGKPFVNFSAKVNGNTLDPGEIVSFPLQFNNTLLRRFNVRAEVRSQVIQ